MPMTVGASWLADHIDGPRAEDVRAGLATLISNGDLRPGTRLPTIRRLAQELNANTSAVATAWGRLRTDGLVETRRRGGTVVLPGRRLQPSGSAEGPSRLDLLDARPEPDFVPDIRESLLRAMQPPRHVAKVKTITPDLLAAVETRHPFPAERFTVMPGGLASLNSLLDAVAGIAGDGVALESPTLMRSVSVAERGARRVRPVGSDRDGPIPDSVRSAIADGARVLVFQPHWSVPLGATLTAARADELAEVLEAPDAEHMLVIEEDTVGPFVPSVSLGVRLPGRVVRITQYGRAYGPDLGIAVIGGPARVVDLVRETQRTIGLRVSPLLQDTLAHLVEDGPSTVLIGHAAERYAARRRALTRSLWAFGLEDASFGGLFALVPVDDESRAVAALAAVGVTVAPGRRGLVGRSAAHHVRIAATGLPDEPHALSELVATIASALRGEVTVDGD